MRPHRLVGLLGGELALRVVLRIENAQPFETRARNLHVVVELDVAFFARHAVRRFPVAVAEIVQPPVEVDHVPPGVAQPPLQAGRDQVRLVGDEVGEPVVVAGIDTELEDPEIQVDREPWSFLGIDLQYQLAWLDSSDQAIWDNLALASIGGMVSSTVLLLVCMPALYYGSIVTGWAVRDALGWIGRAAGTNGVPSRVNG